MQISLCHSRPNELENWQTVQRSSSMKLSISLALFTALFITACSEPAPPPPRQPVASYQTAPPPDYLDSPAPQSTAPAESVTQTKGDIPYGVPVPNKPGFVTSPYAPNQGYVDVRGFPPGTEVRDPYTNKIFLVP